ncbi:MAG: response regulator [Peptococcaceae bacterium]|nr:response regulator [Peptococcaceae bacterium]
MERVKAVSRILIVDDSSTVRRYYREVLEGAGHQVEEAANGYEALERVYTGKFDMLLVDVNMPKMDGYSFLSEIRRARDLDQAPALMITTEGDTGDVDRGFRAGCNMYFVKPVKPEELLAFVEILG